MGSKLAFILSLFFVAIIFALLGDVITIQFIYTNLDAVSATAGYIIAKEGRITDEVILLVEKEAGAFIEACDDSLPLYGSVYEFIVYRPYDPLFISDETIKITVTRSVIIGYYN